MMTNDWWREANKREEECPDHIDVRHTPRSRWNGGMQSPFTRPWLGSKIAGNEMK